MRYWALLIIIFILASCHHQEYNHTEFKNPANSLESRVHVFWKAWLAKEWDTVISMADPEIREDFVAQVRSFAENPKAEYLDYTIVDAEIDGDTALVEYQMTIKYLHPLLVNMIEPQEVTLFDNWIQKDGAWYRTVEKPDVSNFLESINNL